MENNLAVEALMTYNNLLKDNPDLILQDFPEELILAFYKLKFPQNTYRTNNTAMAAYQLHILFSTKTSYIRHIA